MRQVRKTALSLAAAQVALLWSELALAQTAPAPKPADAPADSQTIVVTGQRRALESAQKIKRESDEIVDSIVADDIGKLPDRSVTEVLQRIVGISMDRTQAKRDPEHFSVEGSGISIRGLSWVRSELNGRDSFSANGGRSLNFEDVPPELLAGIDVYKNPSAEQIEGAIGGLVNLRTALPLDFSGLRVSLAGSETYATLNKKRSPSFSALFSNRWDTEAGRFGALIHFARSDSNVRSDFFQVDPYFPRTDAYVGQPAGSTVWVPKGASWRTEEFGRKREGLYGALQWKLNDIESSLTLFRSKYRMRWDEQAIFVTNDPYKTRVTNGVFDGAGALVSGTLANADGTLTDFNDDTLTSQRTSSTRDVGWRLKWKANDRWSFASDLQVIRAKTDATELIAATGVQLPKQTIDLGGSTPGLTFDATDRAILADPNNYYWAFTQEHLQKSVAKEKAWKGDATFNFDDPVLQDLRFGVRLTDREAKTSQNPSNYHWQAITQPWTQGGLARLSTYPGGTQLTTFDNFFNGKVPAPPAVVFPAVEINSGFPDSYTKLHEYGRAQCLAGTTDPAQLPNCNNWPFAYTAETLSDDINSRGTNLQSERTQAAYAQLRFAFNDWKLPLDGNVGLRVVHTKAKAHGYVSFGGSNQADVNSPGVPVPNIPAYAQPRDFENSYTNVLPSLNLRLKASSNLQFRFALAKAISRPDFTDLQAYTTLSQSVTRDPGSPAITSVSHTGESLGNPLLKPIRSTQADVTAEWYFSRSGSLTFAVFDKELDDVIVPQRSSYQVADVSGTLQTFNVTAPVNGAKGYARGFELAFRDYFDKLPGWLAGIGLEANYTFVDSKTQLYNPVALGYCSGTNGGLANAQLTLAGCDTDGRTFGNLPLQNLSKNAYTLAFLYDRGPLSMRLAYTWRSKYLQGVNVNGTNGTNGTDTNPNSPTFGQPYTVAFGLPTWADAYGQLDGGIFYKLLDEKLTLGLEAQNLNDAKQRQLMQQHIGNKTRALFYTGPRYTVTARYTF